MVKHKFGLAYVFLVGLPSLGLVGILRAGANLVAPLAVHGNWTVEADLNSWRGLPCGKLLTDAQQPLMNIAQSGRVLTVTINNPGKTMLTGTLTGTTVNARVPSERQETEGQPSSNCLDPHPLRLQATVAKLDSQTSLKGTFSLSRCDTCPVLAFNANSYISK